MNKQPIAYFARHGETTQNAGDTFRSGNHPLNEHGIQDADNLQKWFATKDISAVYSSGLTRTQETAAKIAVPKGLKVQPLPSLNAINVGYLGGEPKKDHENVMDYFGKFPNEKIPGGESLTDFRERTQPPLKKILVEAAHSDKPVLAVVHSSVIHELNHIISGDHNQVLVKPGGVVGVYNHPKHGLALKALVNPETEKGSDVPYHG